MFNIWTVGAYRSSFLIASGFSVSEVTEYCRRKREELNSLILTNGWVNGIGKYMPWGILNHWKSAVMNF